MSSRRAAIRREQKEANKIKKDKTANGVMLRAAEQGRLDGRLMAFCAIANFLFDTYGFRKKRIEAFLEKCNKQATRFDNDVIQFVIQSYAVKFKSKLNNIDYFQKPESIIEHVYLTKREEFYIYSIALMLMVLNDAYGMSSNKKSSGRLDMIMEHCVKEYEKNQSKKENFIKAYTIKTAEKTGLRLYKE